MPVARERRYHSPGLRAGRELLWDSPTMCSACLFVRPSPLGSGQGIGCRSAKVLTGGSADLMNFYATTYAVAHGRLHFRPRIGHHTGAGYVANNFSAISSLLHPWSPAEGRCQDTDKSDTAQSTTAADFKPFYFPDSCSLLPQHVHQVESGFLQESPFTCLYTGAADPPETAREHSTKSHCTGPAQPDVLQKMTIGTKEHSGFTKALLRTDRVLPTQPDQPLSVSITTTDYQPFVYSNGSEKLPVLPVRSERGSGFTREVPSSRSLGTASLPTMYHPVVLISRGLEAPRVTQATLLGRQDIGRKELSGFAINHSQYVPPRPTLSPAAPTQCWQDPAWTVRSIMGIQPMRSSGFVTNNLRDTQPWQ